MKITNKNFYFITFTALAALSILALYYFSRKSNCCGECHVHGTPEVEQVSTADQTDTQQAPSQS